jgi:serine phosphatase RsbU (regulator of sigma subunit)
MVILAEKRRLLYVGNGPVPQNLFSAADGQWEVQSCPGPEDLSSRLGGTDLVVIPLPEANWLDPRELSDLLEAVDRSGTVAVLLAPPYLADHYLLANRRGQFVVVDAGAPPRDLAARLETAAALQPAIKHLRADLVKAQSLCQHPAGVPGHLDEEMRLAARLQQDFLPRTLPQVGPVRFAALFRPAGWVSGDIYDVFRLDESHVGFYVADSVGHGLPAALLTMFIKKALQTKRISGNTYQIVPPHEALMQLNGEICQQDFTSCQFCTAFYGIVNTSSLALEYARAGHPSPLLLARQGPVRHLRGEGTLLGIFPGQTLALCQAQLARGDRVVVFSDGAEEIFSCPPGPEALEEKLAGLLHLSAEEMLLHLSSRMDDRRQDPSRKDDITILVMDVTAGD